jgi:type IV secretion system protein VirB9
MITSKKPTLSTLAMVATLLPGALAAAEDTQPEQSSPLSTSANISSARAFEFAEGTSYLVTTAMLRVTDIALEPGEEIRTIASGDTLRWKFKVDKRDGTTQHVLLKPMTMALSTNLILRTNRRTYLLDLRSATASEPFMAEVEWTYPAGESAQVSRSGGSDHS